MKFLISRHGKVNRILGTKHIFPNSLLLKKRYYAKNVFKID